MRDPLNALENIQFQEVPLHLYERIEKRIQIEGNSRINPQIQWTLTGVVLLLLGIQIAVLRHDHINHDAITHSIANTFQIAPNNQIYP